MPSKGTNAQGNNVAHSYNAPGNVQMAQNDLTENNHSGSGYVCDDYNHRIDSPPDNLGVDHLGPDLELWLAYNHSATVTASYTRLATEPPGTTNTWSITGLVQGWVNGTVPNKRGDAAAVRRDPGPGRPLLQRQRPHRPRQAAQAAVTYTAPPNIPDQLAPADATRFTTTPVLKARYLSPQGTSGKVSFVVKDRSGTQVSSHLSALVASGSVVSFTPPTLPDGTYYWQARGGGGNPVLSVDRGPGLCARQDGRCRSGHRRAALQGLDNAGLTDRMGVGAGHPRSTVPKPL